MIFVEAFSVTVKLQTSRRFVSSSTLHTGSCLLACSRSRLGSPGLRRDCHDVMILSRILLATSSYDTQYLEPSYGFSWRTFHSIRWYSQHPACNNILHTGSGCCVSVSWNAAWSSHGSVSGSVALEREQQTPASVVLALGAALIIFDVSIVRPLF